ncbi:MAG TPA: RNA polymerase factor sigma-54 [Saprospiraceae bacterium]|nr:RNA polymerase factor sigma-54 [Saprospiraceae bacterium]
MIRQQLSQKLLQKLSPQQIQLMKLLQIPTVSLEQRIKEELEANPALEEPDNYNESASDSQDEKSDAAEKEKDEDYELDDYLNDYIEDDPVSYHTMETPTEQREKNLPAVVSSTFHDYLDQQLGLLNLDSEVHRIIAQQIIGSIDDTGYLRRDIPSLIDDILFAFNIEVTTKQVVEVLAMIQRFDPPGVGARDLRETLMIQLQQRLNLAEAMEEEQLVQTLKLAQLILTKYFEAFSKKHFSRLQRQLEISEAQLKGALDEILKLNPKPASGYTSQFDTQTQTIIPDFMVTNRDGELELTMDLRNAPDLRINDQYVDMLKSYQTKREANTVKKENKEAIIFIKQKIDSAKWFIDAIKQRQHTLKQTMYAIMQFQKEFFLTGDSTKLKPMILRDIAELTSLDISTVSRVASSKFVQTEFGTKRLKDFFSESIVNVEGDEVSTQEVKSILGEIIAGEHKRKPLSDEKLRQMLEHKGYSIARRTVAKYREQLNIPVARLRKEL